MDGDILVTAPGWDSATLQNEGVAYLFDGASGALLTTISNPTPKSDDAFGGAVAARSGEFLIVGRGVDVGTTDQAGVVYQYYVGAGTPVPDLLEVEGQAGLRLGPGIPNPFTNQISIHYSVPSEGEARLTIHDVLGRKVKTLASGPHEQGPHHALWDGTDLAGWRVASGVYFALLSAGGEERTTRIVMRR
jgi:hypothetical protein